MPNRQLTEQEAHATADIMLQAHLPEIKQHITSSEIELRRNLMHNVIKSKYRD